MKKTTTYLLLALTFFLTGFQLEKYCDGNQLKKELKPSLQPDYRYDSSKISQFKYTSNAHGREILVPLYKGEEYLFLFNTNGLPKDIKVEIYSERIGHKNRKLLYQLEKKEGQSIYSFKPTKSRRMYVNYTIPAVEEELEGCMLFMLGYR